MAEGEILGEVDAPRELVERELEAWGGRRGSYGISELLKEWLRSQLS
ncbi:MAG: hypothetical protein GWN86_29220 [Desulfobacterales bacterium]|nr:hypothetical protein [Desulfobacterales bacterium]